MAVSPTIAYYHDYHYPHLNFTVSQLHYSKVGHQFVNFYQDVAVDGYGSKPVALQSSGQTLGVFAAKEALSELV